MLRRLNRRWVFVLLSVLGGLCVLALGMNIGTELSRSKKITTANFLKIQEGMTAEDVSRILGPPTGESILQKWVSFVTYSVQVRELEWRGCAMSIKVVVFENSGHPQMDYPVSGVHAKELFDSPGLPARIYRLCGFN